MMNTTELNTRQSEILRKLTIMHRQDPNLSVSAMLKLLRNTAAKAQKGITPSGLVDDFLCK